MLWDEWAQNMRPLMTPFTAHFSADHAARSSSLLVLGDDIVALNLLSFGRQPMPVTLGHCSVTVRFWISQGSAGF
jgi:hypothetical protein